MNNLFLLREELRENGERLAYQFLDGLNWKQYTYLDIINSIVIKLLLLGSLVA